MKKLFKMALVACMVVVSTVSAFASDSTGEFPIIPEDTRDWSNTGEMIYTYDADGFIIQSYEATDEELNLAETFSQPHIHPSIERHVLLSV